MRLGCLGRYGRYGRYGRSMMFREFGWQGTDNQEVAVA